MSMGNHWREIPAGKVEEVIRRAIGVFPPTLEELAALAKRHDYDVVYTRYYPVAVTEPETKVINIPPADGQKMLTDLLHEVAELLLKQPVAEEYVHPPTGQDEHHNVAVIATERLRASFQREKRRLQCKRTALLERREATEQVLDTIAVQAEALVQAIKERRYDVLHAIPAPDPVQTSLCSSLVAELNRQIDAIDSRLGAL